MIIEGVLNHGLVLAEELHPSMWQGVPITVGHPLDANGIPHSARQPDVLATCGLGHVFHTTLATSQRQGHPVTSLRGELWINLAQAAQCGPEGQQAVAMLESQTPLEVSTAFFSYAERATGTFYGVPYQEIHHRLEPDHLALLPNSVGACSLLDGCGAPRLHQDACGCDDPYACACHEGDDTMDTTPPRLWNRMLAMFRLRTHQDGAETLTIEQTDLDIREGLYSALAREMGDQVHMTPYFIQDLDVPNQTFTYREGERLKRRHWQMAEGLLVLAPEIEDVQRETLYHPVAGPPGTPADTPPGPTTEEAQDPEDTPQAEEFAMPPTAIIKRRVDALIANERTKWTEAERHHLEGMDEALLIILEQMPLLPPVTEPPKPRTFEDLLRDADPEIRESHSEALENIAERKDAAIAILRANPNCDFTDEELRSMTAKRLEKTALMAGAQLTTAANPDYRGRGLAAPRAPVDPETLPPPPPNTSERVLARQKELGMGAYFR